MRTFSSQYDQVRNTMAVALTQTKHARLSREDLREKWHSAKIARRGLERQRRVRCHSDREYQERAYE